MTASTIYVERDSGLHRLNPLTALALVGFSLVAGLALPGVLTPYLVFSLVVAPLAAWGRVLRRLLSTAFKIVLPFAVSAFLIQGLFWTNGTPVVHLGPLSLKREGLIFAVRSTGRILVVVGSFLLLSLTVRPDKLMIALQQRGIPNALTYIILTTIQVIPHFQAKANTILDAQRSRGLETEGSLRTRVRALAPLAVPLVLGSIVDIEERAIALEARAFSRHGPKTSLMILSDSRMQQIMRWLLVAGIVLAAAAGIWLRL
jgi:energy-coupling factor transport system permease protein